MNAQQRVALSIGMMIMEMESLKDENAHLKQELSKTPDNHQTEYPHPDSYDPITPEG